MCFILFRGSLLSCSFFVLRHWWVSQVFTPRMSLNLPCLMISFVWAETRPRNGGWFWRVSYFTVRYRSVFFWQTLIHHSFLLFCFSSPSKYKLDCLFLKRFWRCLKVIFPGCKSTTFLLLVLLMGLSLAGTIGPILSGRLLLNGQLSKVNELSWVEYCKQNHTSRSPLLGGLGHQLVVPVRLFNCFELIKQPTKIVYSSLS